MSQKIDRFDTYRTPSEQSHFASPEGIFHQILDGDIAFFRSDVFISRNYLSFGDNLNYAGGWHNSRCSQEVVQEIERANNTLETYTFDHAFSLLRNDPALATSLSVMQQTLQTIVQDDKLPTPQVNFRPPLPYEESRKQTDMWQRQVPGIDVSMTKTNDTLAQRWRTIRRQAAFEEVPDTSDKEKIDPLELLDQTLAELQLYLTKRIFINRLSLGVPIDVVTDPQLSSYYYFTYHPEIHMTLSSEDISHVELGIPSKKTFFRLPITYKGKQYYFDAKTSDIDRQLTDSVDLLTQVSDTPEKRAQFVEIMTCAKVLDGIITIRKLVESKRSDDEYSNYYTVSDAKELLDKATYSDEKLARDLFMQRGFGAIVKKTDDTYQIAASELRSYFYKAALLGEFPHALSLGAIEEYFNDVLYPRTNRNNYNGSTSVLSYLRARSKLMDAKVDDAISSHISESARIAFDDPRKEYDALSQPIFSITGDAEQLSRIQDVVFAPYFLRGSVYSLPHLRDESKELTLTILKPVVPTSNNLLSLALPPGYEITDISLVIHGQKKRLSYPMMIKDDLGHVAVELPYRVVDSYTLKIRPVEQKIAQFPYITLGNLEIANLQSVAQRLQEMGPEFALLSQNISAISTKPVITSYDLQEAIKASLQYTILGIDESIDTDFYAPYSWERSVANAANGIDQQTQKLRVQCDQARVLTKLILDKIFLSSQINPRKLAKRLSQQGNELLAGPLHVDIMLTPSRISNSYTIIDTTPNLDPAVLRRELPQGQESGHIPSLPHKNIRAAIRGYMRQLEKYILNEKGHAKDTELKKPENAQIYTLTGKQPPHHHLMSALAYVYQHPKIAPDEIEYVRKILQETVAYTEAFQGYTPLERKKHIEQMAKMYRAPFEQYNIGVLGLIAHNALLLLQN